MFFSTSLYISLSVFLNVLIYSNKEKCLPPNHNLDDTSVASHLYGSMRNFKRILNPLLVWLTYLVREMATLNCSKGIHNFCGEYISNLCVYDSTKSFAFDTDNDINYAHSLCITNILFARYL